MAYLPPVVLIARQYLLDFAGVAQAILDMPDADFDRVDSAFDHKFVMRDKFDMPKPVAGALHYLESNVLQDIRADANVLSLRFDTTRHYAGVFKYTPGDELLAHVDAGLHPETGRRKHFTAVLFLGHGAGNLRFWHGDKCTDPDPKITAIHTEVSPKYANLVVFENNDTAWHDAAPNLSTETRLSLTVSYMSDELTAFDNKRTRAFFVPRPGMLWSEAMYVIRDERAEVGHIGHRGAATR